MRAFGSPARSSGIWCSYIIFVKSQLTFLQQIALLSLQVQYISLNLREIIILHVVKAAIIAISAHFNPLCGQSHSEY